MLIKTKRSKRSGGCIFHLILVSILSILILSVNNRGRRSAGNLFNGKNPLSVTKVVCWQSLITAGVCTQFCLIVMQDFFIYKTSIFKRQFAYSGPILESGHACDFSKKGQNIWNLKIFLKSAGDCMQYYIIICIIYVKMFTPIATQHAYNLYNITMVNKHI